MTVFDTPNHVDRHPQDGWEMAEPYPLGHRSRRALRALIRTLCPATPKLDDLEDRIEDHVRRIVRYMHPLVARGFVVSLHLLNWAPVWLLRNSRPIHDLSREKAATVLEALAESRILSLRMLLMGVRSMVLSTYFDQDEVHRAMNYAPAPHLRQRIALRRRLLAAGRSEIGMAISGAKA